MGIIQYELLFQKWNEVPGEVLTQLLSCVSFVTIFILHILYFYFK